MGLVEHLLELPGGRELMEVEDNYGLNALDFATEDGIWMVVAVLMRHHARRRPLRTTV